MKRLALAFSTKDKTELTRRTIEPLHHPDIDLYWLDGSDTDEGIALTQDERYHEWITNVRVNVKGGADAAIAYALSWTLQSDADYVGLCESDVLLHRDWLGPALALFDRGRADGLEVGAVSARCYEDRILCQCDGYALAHNLGAGHIILTRQAARLILDHARVSWATENRKIFAQLSGVDIGRYWAFRGNQQFICMDWGFDRVLAAHGLASLALTPSPVEMIGQVPPLHEQGLKLVTEPVELLRNDAAFERFVQTTRRIRAGELVMPDQRFLRQDDGSTIIFPHQLAAIGGYRTGDWHLKWAQGFGPFAFVAGEPTKRDQWDKLGLNPQVFVPIAGPCEVFVGGGPKGGKMEVTDTHSGYSVAPALSADDGNVTTLAVPGGVSYRTIKITALDPGTIFYGLKAHDPQPVDPRFSFDHSQLPPPNG